MVLKQGVNECEWERAMREGNSATLSEPLPPAHNNVQQGVIASPMLTFSV
jgi:hypothetical protein